LRDEVANVGHQHVTTEPRDQCLFTVLALALTQIARESHHVIGHSASVGVRVIIHYCRIGTRKIAVGFGAGPAPIPRITKEMSGEIQCSG
jgi:carbonic anhydrase/acetyltransferase-like protein (isoleucine patch superfamily)